MDPNQKRPQGRPNELEPAFLTLLHQYGDGGVTVNEAALVLPHTANGRRTVRALSGAASRLWQKGVVVRREEWFRPEGNPTGAALRYRYWHIDHAPSQP